MSNLSYERPVALITGASSGIGWVTAKALAVAGYRVALTARRAERLETLAGEITRSGGVALAVPADLTEPAERARVVSTVREQFGRIDVLVNNAGFGWWGPQISMPTETWRRMLALNVDAVVDLTMRVLPEMAARRSGHVVNVGSVAGDVAVPGRVLYAATKSLVDTFSTGLRRESRGTGVRVSTIKPGPVRTEFLHVALGLPPDDGSDVERGVSPERVASAIVQTLQTGRSEVYVPGVLAIIPLGAALLGWALDRLIGLYAWTERRRMGNVGRKTKDEMRRT